MQTRNVLVDAIDTCKVADFGLARGIVCARSRPDASMDGDEEAYYRSRTGTFPVRWTSPDSMQTMRFSEASDVWSFGVVMLEIWTGGGKPYDGLNNAEVITRVQGGYRAPKPSGCGNEIYDVMLQCWSATPSDRPTFAQAVSMLQDFHVAASDIFDDGGETHSNEGLAAANDDTYLAPGKSVAFAKGAGIRDDDVDNDEYHFPTTKANTMHIGDADAEYHLAGADNGNVYHLAAADVSHPTVTPSTNQHVVDGGNDSGDDLQL